VGRLLIVGAGEIGTAAAQAALADGVVTGIVGAVDPDPDAREQLRQMFGTPGYANSADLPPAREGDLALVAFSSRAEVVAPEIVRLVSVGYHVVTTCEELAWPERHVLQALETSARTDSRVVVVTGANPGFVMDRLPLLAALASRHVRSVAVIRRVDTSTRRDRLVAKTGRGLSVDEFERAVKEGTVGHAGLVASGRLIASGLGWQSHDTRETIEPVLADGVVAGLRQQAVIRTPDRNEIRLEMEMVWGAVDPLDRVVVDGDPPITLEIAGGYHGDTGTTAQVLTALANCHQLAPGFYRPGDLPLAVRRPGP
jgi:2,4-diaminopentanoate dehydrogenase